YLVYPDMPPVMILGFDNIEEGRNIFSGLRKKIGDEDKKEQLRVSVVKGLDSEHPHGYGVIVGTNIAANVSASGHVVLVQRMQRMNPQTSENLDRFMKAFTAFGCYVLAPGQMGKMDGSLVQEVNTFGIFKRKIEFREAWTIEAHDPDMSILDVDDEPIVPPGIKDPPVF